MIFKKKQAPKKRQESQSFREIVEMRKRKEKENAEIDSKLVYRREENMFLKKVSLLYGKEYEEYVKANKQKDVKLKEDFRWLKSLKRGGLEEDHKKLIYKNCIDHAKKIFEDPKRPLKKFFEIFMKEVNNQISGMIEDSKQSIFCNVEKILMDFNFLPDLIMEAMIFHFDKKLVVEKDMYPLDYFLGEMKKLVLRKSGKQILLLLKTFPNVEIEKKLDRCRLFIFIETLPFKDKSLMLVKEKQPYLIAIQNLTRIKNTSIAKLHVKVIENTFYLIFSTLDSYFPKKKKISAEDLSLIILYIILNIDVNYVSSYFYYIKFFKDVESPVFDLFYDVLEYINSIEILSKQDVKREEQRRIEEAEMLKEKEKLDKKMKQESMEYDDMLNSLLGKLGFDGSAKETHFVDEKDNEELDREIFKTKSRLGLRRNERKMKEKLGLYVTNSENIKGQVFNPPSRRKKKKQPPQPEKQEFNYEIPTKTLPKPKQKGKNKRKKSSRKKMLKREPRSLPNRFPKKKKDDFDDFEGVLGNVLDKLESPVPLTINNNQNNERRRSFNDVEDEESEEESEEEARGSGLGGLGSLGGLDSLDDSDESFIKGFNRRHSSTDFDTLSKQANEMNKRKVITPPYGGRPPKAPKVKKQKVGKKKLFGLFGKKDSRSGKKVQSLENSLKEMKKENSILKKENLLLAKECKSVKMESEKLKKKNAKLEKKAKSLSRGGGGGLVVEGKSSKGDVGNNKIISRLRKEVAKLKKEIENVKSMHLELIK